MDLIKRIGMSVVDKLPIIIVIAIVRSVVPPDHLLVSLVTLAILMIPTRSK